MRPPGSADGGAGSQAREHPSRHSPQDQGKHYAEQLGVPFVFLSNGEEVRFLDRETDAHARQIAGFFAQDDLEWRIAARRNRRDLSTIAIDRKIVDRDYQIECIEALSAEVLRGRRKLLVEMATGTGKTRTAAAFIKRLFDAGVVTRVLFLVDRIALARQAEDAWGHSETKVVEVAGALDDALTLGAHGLDRRIRPTCARRGTRQLEFIRFRSAYGERIRVLPELPEGGKIYQYISGLGEALAGAAAPLLRGSPLVG